MKKNCELDFLISSKEISDGISKLKSGKGQASGLDGIPNEMLNAGSSILNSMLQKLFNLIVSSGQCNGLQHIYLQYLSQVSKPENQGTDRQSDGSMVRRFDSPTVRQSDKFNSPAVHNLIVVRSCSEVLCVVDVSQ